MWLDYFAAQMFLGLVFVWFGVWFFFFHKHSLVKTTVVELKDLIWDPSEC